MFALSTPTVSIFEVEDLKQHNHIDVLVEMWLEEQEDDISIETIRQNEENINCLQKQNQAEQEMKVIGQKLDRLEKTWLHQHRCTRASNEADREMSSKYEELNSINQKINNVLSKMALENKTKPGLDSVKKKLIAMYNRSVQVLTDQDRYTKKSQIIRQKKELCQKTIQQTTQEIQNSSKELQRILSIRQLASKKLARLENVFS